MNLVGIDTVIDSFAGVTATRTGDGVLGKFARGEAVVFRLEYTVNSGTTPTFDVVIQHSHVDTAAKYSNLLSFPQLTLTSGSGILEVHLPIATMGILPYLRAVSTITGTLNIDAVVTLWTN